ncbi:hypothetical protein KKF91_18360 [Myxococcota bacterium]|nr:hypothetical protein [Myxococcota bacterium]MBU1899107.1 hypothetical protein [Myxococcota bacterium]
MDGHDMVQALGKALLVYIYSLMKTGEIHDLNNDAWHRPIEKFKDVAQRLLALEQSVTVVITEGVAQVNSHALWLDPNVAEQANELEGWLARREAGGIVISELPSNNEVLHFFYEFARFRPAPDEEAPFQALTAHLEGLSINRLRIAPRPLRLEGVGRGVRGVPSLWFYAKHTAALQDFVEESPLQLRVARRMAQEIVDACAAEQDLLLALTTMGQEDTPARRALDACIFVAAISRGLGLAALDCAENAAAALLHCAGQAYDNPDPNVFNLPEITHSLIINALIEGAKLSGHLATQINVGVSALTAFDPQAAPYLIAPPRAHPVAQLVAIGNRYLDMLRGVKSKREHPTVAALRLLEEAPEALEPSLVRLFVAVIGVLPVGTLVELQNNDIGVIADVDHLRGREVYRAASPPVLRPQKITVERMRDHAGRMIPERRARVILGEDAPDGGAWRAERVLESKGLEDLQLRGLIRRPSTVIAQIGLR